MGCLILDPGPTYHRFLIATPPKKSSKNIRCNSDILDPAVVGLWTAVFGTCGFFTIIRSRWKWRENDGTHQNKRDGTGRTYAPGSSRLSFLKIKKLSFSSFNEHKSMIQIEQVFIVNRHLFWCRRQSVPPCYIHITYVKIVKQKILLLILKMRRLRHLSTLKPNL